MKSSARICLVVLILMGCISVPVPAGSGDPGDWEFGLFAGQGFPDSYARDVGPAIGPEDDVLYGARIGYWVDEQWSLETSFQTLSNRTSFGGMPTDFDMKLGAMRFNGLFHFRPGARVRPFVTIGVGGEWTDVPTIYDEVDPGLNVGAGFRARFSEHFGGRFDARYALVDTGSPLSDRQSNVEASIGVYWLFGGRTPDADGDGVRDRKDDCPDTPRGADVDERGCPSDGDGDGVYDGIDRCPDTPTGDRVDGQGCSMDSDGDGVNDGPDRCPDTPRGARVDASGCPGDSDGDGVYDGLDACPDTPRGATVDARGCPSDNDRDGVYDGIDQCPGTAAGAKVDARGCALDSDGDGVGDGIDQCPGTPAGRKVDARGCELLFEEKRDTLVLRGVNFEFNSAELTEESRGILDSVAQSLVQSYTEVRIEVGGHTDSKGSDSYNRDLSRKRAQAVLDHLAAKGVDRDRMEAKGYGESQPIGENESEAGRAENRRVELKRLN